MTRLCVVALAVVVSSACGDADTARSTTARPPVEGRAPAIRMEVPVAPDMLDLPGLLAKDALQANGYTVETVSYSQNPIAIQAMLSGNLDLARIPLPQAFAAIQQGAAITMIVLGGDQSRILASAPEIKKCSDLNNKQVAVPNLISAQTLTLKRYIATRCPGTKIELVVIAGIENRLAALLANRTSGALLEAANLFELQRVHGARFNVLSDMTVDFPALNGAAFVAPRAFLEKYPVTARDIVREIILATRRIQELAALQSAVEKYLKLEPGAAAGTAQLYLKRKVWDVNGGLSDEALHANIDFFVEAGALKPGLTPALAADRSYLTAVLDEIGRR